MDATILLLLLGGLFYATVWTGAVSRVALRWAGDELDWAAFRLGVAASLAALYAHALLSSASLLNVFQPLFSHLPAFGTGVPFQFYYGVTYSIVDIWALAVALRWTRRPSTPGRAVALGAGFGAALLVAPFILSRLDQFPLRADTPQALLWPRLGLMPAAIGLAAIVAWGIVQRRPRDAFAIAALADAVTRWIPALDAYLRAVGALPRTPSFPAPQAPVWIGGAVLGAGMVTAFAGLRALMHATAGARPAPARAYRRLVRTADEAAAAPAGSPEQQPHPAHRYRRRA